MSETWWDDWPYGDLKRIGADYGRVWHLTTEILLYSGETLCGKSQSRWNQPRNKRMCSKCHRLAVLRAVEEGT